MLLDEIIKAIVTAWDDAETGYSLYFTHGPQGKTGTPISYPFVVFDIIDSPKTYSMRTNPSDTPAAGDHTYAKIRVQFTVWCNEEQLATGIGIVDTIEDIYKFTQLTCDTISNMGNYIGNQSIKFFNEGQKVYSLSSDIIFFVGV